jgi:hypothetical protein
MAVTKDLTSSSKFSGSCGLTFQTALHRSRMKSEMKSRMKVKMKVRSVMKTSGRETKDKTQGTLNEEGI